jgi:superfamily II DNA or RNA helicase
VVEGVEVGEGAHATIVRLVCIDDDAQGQPLDVVWELELDTEILDEGIWRSIGTKGFDSARYFAAYLHTLRWNCVTATDPKLFQSPFRAGIRIDPYQLEPLRKALLLPRVNLFIADDVGLGKTIEAGLIACELLLRRRVREVVVACPPSMVSQWKDELEARFGLTFEIFDREYMDRMREERGYSTNPWDTFPRFIISHRLLIDETYAAPLRDWLDKSRQGKLLILDEAHHAAPSSGSRYAIDSKITRAIREIAERFEHRLFLSATPHNGHSNSFSALLELLDPQRFTRGVKVVRKNLEDVMVRRLKDDIRELEGGFPERKICQVDLPKALGQAALPPETAELRLSALLDEYRQVRQLRMAGATKRKQAEAALLISGLQQRLLSSIEAFARTLKKHRQTMERLWAAPAATAVASRPVSEDLLVGTLDNDSELASAPESELAELEEAAVSAATEATAGNQNAADVMGEKALLTEMERIAELSRYAPDARVRYLINWIRDNLCPGARNPGQPCPRPGARWTDLRVLIFTEYEDTRRYLVTLLNAAIAETELADERIAVFHGPTPADKRDEIKRAFNAPPEEHPVRILVATDAAREGLNLQAHCWNLFHFDVPWNPSRMEQRNGRIDRKLQPSDEVYCHYFVYTQRPEDRILKALVRKTETIRRELGSLAQVLEARIGESIRAGIRHDEIDRIEADIDGAGLDAARRATAEEELEVTRQRRDDLKREIDTLKTRIQTSEDSIGLDKGQLRDALSSALELIHAKPLASVPTPGGQPERFVFPNLNVLRGGDPDWTSTLDTLRALPKYGERDFRWRRESPIRPVIFDAPPGIDDDVVQLHLSHRIVQRLLSNFTSQGFVNLDLSRACLAQSDDAVPRVILLGRLSLYGKRAVRLHEQLVTVTARWADPSGRRSPLAPYARDAEAKTLSLLEQAIRAGGGPAIPEAISKRLQGALPTDIQDLLPHLTTRADEAAKDATDALSDRGRLEAEGMQKILEDQKKRVQAEFGKHADEGQLALDFPNDAERRQVQQDRKAWQRFLGNVDRDLKDEPARIRDFYTVASRHIQPVGLAYLWPVNS